MSMHAPPQLRLWFGVLVLSVVVLWSLLNKKPRVEIPKGLVSEGTPAAAPRAPTAEHGPTKPAKAMKCADLFPLACLRRGGSAVLVGNLSPKAEFPMQAVVTRELTLYGTCGSAGEYPLCLDLIARGVVRVEPMISAVAPLEEGAAWFDRLSAKDGGRFMKVILTP